MTSIVVMGHALNCSGDGKQRSQLLLTEKTSIVGLKSGERGDMSETNTPAALRLANATPS